VQQTPSFVGSFSTSSLTFCCKACIPANASVSIIAFGHEWLTLRSTSGGPAGLCSSRHAEKAVPPPHQFFARYKSFPQPWLFLQPHPHTHFAYAAEKDLQKNP
jgi:hypothetical protein